MPKVDFKLYLKYIICLILLLVSIYLCILIYYKYKINNKTDLINKLNAYTEEKLSKDIIYPKFNYYKIDNSINKITNDYKDSRIKYEIFINENYLNIFFTIIKDNKIIYKNIDFNINKNKLENIIDYNLYSDLILDKVKYKYSTEIYNEIRKDKFKNCSYKINDDGIHFYFNNDLFKNIPYVVFIYIPNENEEEVFTIKYDKVIAFTFDDGPSDYTIEIMKTLILNNSKATFFELGNRMKYNQEIIKELLSNNMEIGSHTYAHKNLNNLTKEEIDEEVNSTNIIFNEITGENIKLLRTPYGNANDLVKSKVNLPIISWNIDTKDWLYRDSDYVYNEIINKVESGDIILMHDIYPETVEAVKKVVPYLTSKGYKITTVSELANTNNINLEKGKIYRSLKEQ